jgi:feruloyl esterase
MTIIVSLLLAGALGGAPQQGLCEALAGLSLPDASITAAESVAAGPYGQQALRLPAHCRVAAVLTPTADSHIEMEIWMPVENWNGKFLAVGNGGWAGSISFAAMAGGLVRGYATASNDTGHTGGNGDFAFGHPEKLVDFAYRAMHEMTVQSRTLISRFYDRGPRLSYYEGCSTGGRQGLMAAQRYPADFDAIIAGAPANPQTGLHAGDLWRGVEVFADPSSHLSREQVALVHDAVISSCDGLDGVEDGLLTDPRMCTFDPASLACGPGSGNACLTSSQVEAVRLGYSPARLESGEVVFPGFARGSEDAWTFITGGNNLALNIAPDTFQLAHGDPEWDWTRFDLDADVRLAREQVGYIDATATDLAEFRDRGGKLILYHGWNDQLIAPENTIRYYTEVLETMGADQDSWLRLYMAPGMAHCRGGVGPNQIDFLEPLDRWRESGTSPDRITATRISNGQVEMTRPLCPHPEIAKWTGTGSTNEAGSFACGLP